MIFEAKNYAHDTYETSETVELLTDSKGRWTNGEPWPEDVAKQYAKNHNPGCEIGYEFIYNAETDEVVVTSVWLNGQRFTLEDGYPTDGVES